MPSISRFFGIVITMYPGDHPRPHFHARYAEHRASLDIQTLDVLAGSLPKRQLRLVRRWARLRRTEIRVNWGLIQDGDPPNQISPLG